VTSTLMLGWVAWCADGSRNLAEFHYHFSVTIDDTFSFADDPAGDLDGYHGASEQLWWQWMDTHVLWIPAPDISNSSTVSSTPHTEAALVALGTASHGALVHPTSASASHSVVNANNVVVGAIRLRLQRSSLTQCDTEESVRNLPSLQCISRSVDFPVLEDGSTTEWQLDSGNVTNRRLMLAQYRPSDAFIYADKATSDAATVCMCVFAFFVFGFWRRPCLGLLLRACVCCVGWRNGTDSIFCVGGYRP